MVGPIPTPTTTQNWDHTWISGVPGNPSSTGHFEVCGLLSLKERCHLSSMVELRICNAGVSGSSPEGGCVLIPQLEEDRISNPAVVGSSPTEDAKFVKRHIEVPVRACDAGRGVFPLPI
jgi:hypothetical protein